MKNLLPLTLAFLITPFIAFAQSDIEIVHVRDNIHLLISPQGGNVTVSVGEDGAFIIDDQLTGRSDIIQAAVKGINDQDIKFVLNTHYHFDHTGGNESFGASDAIIVAHDNVRKRLSTKQFITYFGKEMPALSKVGLPVVTFSKDMTLHYNGDDVKIIHLPAAHTDGDSAAYFENDNVIVTGDTVFNGMYPFIDIEHGGSITGFLAAIDVFLELANDETIIVPGHGGLMNKSDLQNYRDTLAAISKRVMSAKQAGKTLEQTIVMKPTREHDALWGQGIIPPDDFVSMLYNSLSQTK